MVQQTEAWPFAGIVPVDAARGAGESRIGVDVTFLRMASPPTEPPPPLPASATVVRVPTPTIGFYRYLYGMVGHDYCWWLRRAASDGELVSLLTDPRVSIFVLYDKGEPGGFFELDHRYAAQMGGDINIGYFGLMPHLVGHGYGPGFLRCTIDAAWRAIEPQLAAQPALGVRVNTCTADHPRALGTYLRAGFQPLRTVREIWHIPDRLGLPIPARLRV